MVFITLEFGLQKVLFLYNSFGPVYLKMLGSGLLPVSIVSRVRPDPGQVSGFKDSFPWLSFLSHESESGGSSSIESRLYLSPDFD